MAWLNSGESHITTQRPEEKILFESRIEEWIGMWFLTIFYTEKLDQQISLPLVIYNVYYHSFQITKPEIHFPPL